MQKKRIRSRKKPERTSEPDHIRRTAQKKRIKSRKKPGQTTEPDHIRAGGAEEEDKEPEKADAAQAGTDD